MKKILFIFIIVSSLFCFVLGEATFDSNKFSFVENGTFTMGSNEGKDNEKPAHEVTLNYDFIIEKYEVTGKDFCEYLNDSEVTSDGKLGSVILLSVGPKHHKINHDGTNFFVSISMEKEPATSITWYGCLYYCNWLSEKENLSVAYDEMGHLLDSNGMITDDIKKVVGYRLPTEAEWEYVARGASRNSNYAYSGSNDILIQASRSDLMLAYYSDFSNAIDGSNVTADFSSNAFSSSFNFTSISCSIPVCPNFTGTPR